jgi:HK97 family phage portal protein
VSSLPWSHGGDPGASGSMEGNLSLVPVYAATRTIADAVASMPMQAFRKTNDGRAPMALPSLFEQPTNHGSRVDWLGRCMTSLLLRGNAYGLKVGGTVMPNMIEWLHPDKVSLFEGVWYHNGTPLEDQSSMLHIPALVVPGQRLGLSPISACASTMSTGHETQRFMRDWYRNKAVPGMFAQNTEVTIDSDTARVLQERLRSTMRAGQPFVTGKDWKLDVVKLSADDAGFVASSRLTATQIATIYGLPPEMIGGDTGASMTYSTTEQQQIQFITNTLRPWLVRLEAAFSSLLPRPQYVKFNVDSLIRVDTKTRYEVHRIAREIGLNNVDELRALEDREPLPGGQGADYAPLKAAPAPQEAQ